MSNGIQDGASLGCASASKLENDRASRNMSNYFIRLGLQQIQFLIERVVLWQGCDLLIQVAAALVIETADWKLFWLSGQVLFQLQR